MAIGVSGLLPDDKMKEYLIKISSIVLILAYSNKFNESMSIDSLVDLLSVKKESLPNFITITNNKAFIYRDGDVYPQTGFAGAIGTGQKNIIACYYVVKDVAKAYLLNSEMDTLSSPTFMSIMAESLTPYAIG